jgi:hypothetical protein
VTFNVSSGTLAISVPNGPINLGTGAPGSTTTPASLGTVTVSDTRGSNLVWVCRVQSTAFAATGVNDIPASAARYAVAAITTDNGTVTSSNSNDMSVNTVIATHSSGTGNSTTTWNPTMSIVIPLTAQAANGYTGTVTHSVSPT